MRSTNTSTPRHKKKILWYLAGVTLLVGLAVLVLYILQVPGPWLSVFAPPSQTAILINGERITTEEFENAYKDFVNRQRATLDAAERVEFEKSIEGAPGAYYQLTLRSELAEDLIRRRLLQQAARRMSIQIEPNELLSEVKQQLWRFLEQNGVPPEQIEQALNDPKTYQSAFTQGLMELTRWQLLEERLRERVVGPLDPTDAELRQYYEERKLRYYTPELVRVRHILIRLSEDAPATDVEAAQDKLMEIRSQWAKGANFSELARRYSEDELTVPQGGDYGWIQRGDPTGEDFVDAAFSLRTPGDVSAPVRTKRGLHLIQLVERRPARGESFEQIAAEVRSDYIIEKTATMYREWFEQYRARADVRIQLPLLMAYRLESTDREAAVQAYERIETEGKVDDPYLGYYIARLYRQKLDEAQQQLGLLQSNGAREADIAKLNAQIEELKIKIIKNLKKVLAQASPQQEIFEEILKLTPEDAEMHLAFAQFLLGKGQWDEAATQLKTTLEIQPENLEALRQYGLLLVKMNDLEGAIEHLEHALLILGKDNPKERIELQLQLARAYRELKHLDKARQLLRQVLEVDPKHTEANRDLGLLALEQEDYTGAIEALQAARENAPPEDQAELDVLLGRAYAGLGDLDQAEQLFEAALQSASPPSEIYRRLGELYEKRGDREQALRYYHQGLEKVTGWQEREELALRLLVFNPDDVNVRFTLASLYEQSRRYQEAVEQYRTILARQPDSLMAWRSLGDSYLTLQQYPEALNAFQRALPLAKSPPEQAGLWARILRADRAQAKGKLTPTGLEALYQLARLSLQMGQNQQAAQYLTELITADANYKPDEVARLIEELQEKGIEVTLPQAPK